MTQTSRLVLEIDSRDAEQKAADTRRALEALEDAGLSIKPAMDRAGAGLESVGKSATKAKKSIQEERAEIEQLLESINPLAKKLNEVERQELALNKARKAGKIELDTYTEYSKKLAATRVELGRFSESMNRTGISAKQTAAALRGVPAQFTDIAVSLQGGQAPLTVFLQQGGQLKDMFGGAGPAAKALGGYIVGLINPFTVAAGAAAALGAVVFSSQSQFNEYQKALVSAGNAAGTTADQLIQLSTSLAGGRNFSEASEAVIALAKNGRLSGDALTEVARAATELSVATGKGAGEIADQLSNTKANVSALAVEYSDKYGVITQDTYLLIHALEEQGDKIGAIKVLSGAVADEMGRRNKEMVESTRGLARAWDEVKTSVSSVYNQIKAGLSASPELFKLQHLQGQLEDARKLDDKALVKGLEEQVKLAQAAVDAQSKKNEGVAAEMNERKTLVSMESKWDSDGLKYRSNAKKMEDEIIVARREGLEAGKSQLEIEKRIGQIREDYAKKEPKAKTGSIDLTGFNSAENALKSLTASYQNSFKLLDASEKAGLINADEYALQKGALLEKEKSQVESAYQAEIAALEAISAKSSTTSAQRIGIDQKIADARQKMVDTLQKLDTDQDVLSQQTSARNAKDAASYKAFSDSLNDSLKLAQQGLDNQLAGIGLGQEGRQRLQDDLKIRQDYQKQIEKLNRDYAAIVNPSAGQTDNYNKETQDLKDALAQRLASQQDYYVKLKQYQSDWTNGANAALQDYISETNDIAGQTYTLCTVLKMHS
jgi:phage-related minor tail protein